MLCVDLCTHCPPAAQVMVSDAAEVPWNSLALVGRTVAGNATVWKLFSRGPMPPAWLGMMFEKGRLVVRGCSVGFLFSWLALFTPLCRLSFDQIARQRCAAFPHYNPIVACPLPWLLPPCCRLRGGGSQGVGRAWGLPQVSPRAGIQCTCMHAQLRGKACGVAASPRVEASDTSAALTPPLPLLPHRFDAPEDFAPFKLAEGLFYASALENAASAMEIAAIEGRMAALLAAQHLRQAASAPQQQQSGVLDGPGQWAANQQQQDVAAAA